MSDESASNSATDVVTRIYEVGYHVAPTVKEEDVEKVVAEVRASIEKSGGTFIAEGAPSLTKLAYPMTVREGERKIVQTQAYFGWLKFESTTECAKTLELSLKVNPAVVRSLVFKTVREDTRAKMRAPQLREVKRTDIIKSTPKRAVAEEADKAPISEEKLDKALEELTTE